MQEIKETYPKVSIIVPVFNSEKYLKKCLDSLICQTYRNLEIILIDDGSLDTSPYIYEEYTESYSFVQTYRQENGGVSVARNKGLKKATGKYILFVDSDDYVDEYYVELLVNKAEKYGEDYLVACNVLKNGRRCITEFGSKEYVELSREHTALLISNNTLSGFPVNKLFQRCIIQENHLLFDEEIKLCEDLLFCMQYVEKIKRVIIINRPLYFYDVHESSSTGKKGYQPNLLTALEAYDKIMSFVLPWGGDDLLLQLRQEYTIMVIRNGKMMLESRVPRNDLRWLNIKSRLQEIPLKFVFNKNVLLKYRLFFLLLRLKCCID